MNDHPPERSRHCDRTRGIRALLLVLAPATVAAAPLEEVGGWTPYPWLVSVAIATALFVAGLGHHAHERAPRLAAMLAFYLWTGATLVQHLENPGRGLVVLLGVVAFSAYLWPSERLRRRAADESPARSDQDILLTCAVAAFFGLDVWHTTGQVAGLAAVALAFVYATPVALIHRRYPDASRRHRVVTALAAVAAAMPLLSGVAGVFVSTPDLAPLGLASPLLVVSLVARRLVIHWLAPEALPTEPGLLDAILMHPSRVLVLSFLAVCAVGTLLLGLPLVSADGDSLSWLDAGFTAVSATCVTGLIVVDTPVVFNGAGELVVLALIQIGGLGIMVFSTAAVALLGRRMSLSHEAAAVDIVGASSRANLVQAIRVVLLVTFATEAASALLLFAGFLAHGDGVGVAAWRGLFTAISAFCNAGFALQSDSLVPYAGSAYVLTVVGVTIIIGGLGPMVIAALVAWRQPERRTLHARLVLWTSAILLIVPALCIAALEWSGTLAGMSLVDKLMNAAFQSTTLRTAGFNSIDLTLIRPATWTLMILMMFVGGSPGSTAGGAKTTTVAVVVLAIAAVARGHERVEVFGRTVRTATVLRATAVTTLGVLSCCAALVAIQLTQSMPLDTGLFEVVSALATVGLSTGGTGMLDEVGKVIIMICMFAGRVGPLTLFVFLASQAEGRVIYRYPEETVPIG